jgi:hypothetical protein
VEPPRRAARPPEMFSKHALSRNDAVGLGSAGSPQSGQPIICSNLLARRLRRPAEGIGRAHKVHRKVSRFAAGGPVGGTPTGSDRDGRARALENERALEGGSPSVAVLPATS